MTKRIYLKIAIFITAMFSVVLVLGSMNGGTPLEPIAAIEPSTLVNDFTEASISSFNDIDSGTMEESLIKAPIYSVYSLSGESYISVGENKRWPIASLTKLVTALVAREIKATEKIKITEDILKIEDIGTVGNFSTGEIFTRHDLEEAALILSSNVAAEAMARHYGREKFIDTMNSYAFKIGMTDTYFEDPTGLSYKDQSTVEDLNKLVLYILKNAPEIFKLTRTKTALIHDYKSGRNRNISNINGFAGRVDFFGGKTGTTPEAVGNLISIFSKDNGRSGRIVILLGTEDRYNETERLLTIR